jgi:thiamine-monophosphate kinase
VDFREIGELGLIAKIKNPLLAFSPGISEGIGDDAASTLLSPGTDLFSTVDLLVEEVHCDLVLTSAHSLGRNSLAVNLGNIAAMGARGRLALIALTFPLRASVEFADHF